jgi:4,4'-diaponeurosporenoate glycosyltransferase
MTLAIATLVCWLAGFAVLWRMPSCGNSRTPGPCNFAIIIPARNEAANLPALLQSLAQQSTRPAYVLVVDDDSTDRTPDIAREFGARVLPSLPLPDGWRGKTWACQQGAMATDAEHFFFLDADTRLEAEGLSRIVSAYVAGDGAAMSVCPYHSVSRLHEQLSAIFNLVMAAGIGAFTIWPSKSSAMFGQMLMVSRKSYWRAGGHERVKGKVLENVWLSRAFRETGTPVRCFVGKGSLSIRMYPEGIGPLVEGWTKGFASGAGATALPVLILIVAWLSGAVMAVSLFAHARLIVASMIFALYAGQILFLLRRLGSFWIVTAIFYPIPLLFFFAVFARSLLRSRRSVTWKGRAFHAD